MVQTKDSIEVYLEQGQKKSIAGALDWPGWCKVGRNEAEALAALVDYGERYGRIFKGTEIAFQPPADISQLKIVERLEGNATTDFGAPDIAPSADKQPIVYHPLFTARAHCFLYN